MKKLLIILLMLPYYLFSQSSTVVAKIAKDSTPFSITSGTISPKFATDNLKLGGTGTTSMKLDVVSGNVNLGGYVDGIYRAGLLYIHSGLNSNSNTFMGYSNGNALITGQYNSGYGFFNATQLTTGADNSTFGTNAGYYLTTGSSNTLFGKNAHMSTGASYNTILGSANANYGGTGSYNIAIGYRASPTFGNVTQNNQFWLGSGVNSWIYGREGKFCINGLAALGADTLDRLTVRGTFKVTDTAKFIGFVGIGTTTPTSTLDVAGSFSIGAPVTKTTDWTVAATENWIISNRAATNTVTLPTASSFSGRQITIKTIQAQTVVSATSNVVPLQGGAAATAILAATAGKWATLISDGSSWIIMMAN